MGRGRRNKEKGGGGGDKRGGAGTEIGRIREREEEMEEGLEKKWGGGRETREARIDRIKREGTGMEKGVEREGWKETGDGKKRAADEGSRGGRGRRRHRMYCT